MAVATTYEMDALTTLQSVSKATGSQTASSILTTDTGATIAFYYDNSISTILARSMSSVFTMAAPVTVATGVLLDTTQIARDKPVSAAKLANGNFVVVWTSNEATPNIYYRLYDANLNPLSAATLAETTPSESGRPDVAALASGGFVISWEKRISPADYDIVFRRFDSGGVGLDTGPGVVVSASAAIQDLAPSVAGLNDGGFAIGFSRADPGTGNTSIYQAVYNADASTRVAAVLRDATGTINRDVEVLARADGGYTVFYEDSGWTSDVNNTEITAARYSAAGAFSFYTRVTDDIVTNMGPAAAVSSEGFIVTVQDQNNANTDTTGSLIAPNGALLVADVALFSSGSYENTSDVTWVSPSTVRVVTRMNPSTGDDTDVGIAVKDFNVVRRSTGDGVANTIAQASDSLVDIMDGAGGNDVLIGGNGNDSFYGGAGSDEIYGGAGDDTYYIEDALDSLIETPTGGTDYAYALSGILTYTLPTNIEALFFNAAETNQVGVGNASNNSITAYGDHATLIGLDGNDVLTQYDVAGIPSELIGGSGDDTYVVYNRFSSTIESVGQGMDTVYTNHSIYALQSNVEILRYLDAGTHGAGVGNILDNQLFGGTGKDDLFGREGNDLIDGGAGTPNTLLGQQGDDTYIVRASGDTVYEFVGEGTDNVYAYVANFTLPSNVEHLYFQGASASIGVGNALANNLQGSSVADSLNGLDGNDVIMGLSGADTLLGGAGEDLFRYFSTEAGFDRILDFQPGVDKFSLSAGGYTPTAVIGFVQGAGAVSLDPVSTFIHNTANGMIYYDDDGTGPVAAIALAQINLGLSLSATDFIFF